MIDRPICVACENIASYSFRHCHRCGFRFCPYCYRTHDCPALWKANTTKTFTIKEGLNICTTTE